MSAEILSIDRQVLNMLSADSAVQAALGTVGDAAATKARIHSEEAPDGAAEPYIVFDEMDNNDVNAQGGIRAFVGAVYMVKACARGVGYGGLRALWSAVDACMVRYSSSVDVDGVTVYGFVRQSTIRYKENETGVLWYHLGGVYMTGAS